MSSKQLPPPFPMMDARRFADEAGISEAEAKKTLEDAEREKEYITKLHNNGFLNDNGQDNKDIEH